MCSSDLPFSLSAKGWSVLRLPVPEACRREDAVIELRVDPARPQDGKAAADRRFLGLAVRKIWAT